MPLTTGEKLGRYEIVASIGAGGMGEVYRARDPRLNRDVAIKVSAGQFTERFEREAQAIAALNHPHICTLHDVGPNYLVMEYIDGKPLEGPLAPEQALRYAMQICDALEAAHRKNVTHRDLKPANILVTASGVKLLDFGLAKLNAPSISDSATQTSFRTEVGVVMGTAAYMSPEQAKGEEADARSDIFSFGVVLYEMLSGRCAFARASSIETLTATLRDEPPALDAAPPITAIVTRCLRKSPSERFQTIGEVRAALESVRTKPAEKVPSIAVLPFVNMSADKENEYFSDGLAEEILNLLAKISGLKVIARTSSFAFRGKEQDITQIAQTLRAENILEGSVRRAGNRIRVTAQLIQASDGSHLWSERYDRDMTDVFAIQDEIAKAISEALQVHLAPRAKAVNIEAWQHYLKGEYWRVRATQESLARAKQHFEQALEIDPNYAPAFCGLANYYYVYAILLGTGSTREMAALARLNAQKALAIDPTLCEAHNVNAIMAETFDYNWSLGEHHHRLALASDAGLPRMRYCFAMFHLIPRGRLAEATEQTRLALESDPLSMLLHVGVVWCRHCAKDYAGAIDCVRQALQIEPTFHMAWLFMGFAQLGAGMAEEAVASFGRAAELAPWWPMPAACLTVARWLAGDRAAAEQAIGQIVASSGHNVGTALYYAAAGDVDAMFAALEDAYQKRNLFLIFLPYYPLFDPWHTDPRFRSLLERIHPA
jgi:serine/threonine protein kinase/Tfp pilus assembly protein PilF